MNPRVTAGIIRGFERGLLSSASLLANAPDALNAIRCWKRLGDCWAQGRLRSLASRRELDDPMAPFDLGVHLNLTQGAPLTAHYPARLVDAEGQFLGIARLFARLQRSAGQYQAAIAAEFDAQIAVLCDHGLRPTHLNGHQYVELIPQVGDVLPQLLKKFQIPTARAALEPGGTLRACWRSATLGALFAAGFKRHFARQFAARLACAGVEHPRAYFGSSHAGRIDAAVMKAFLAAAPNGAVIEIGMHPALGRANEGAMPKKDAWYDPLASRRAHELRLLESPELVKLLLAHGCRLGRLAAIKPPWHGASSMGGRPRSGVGASARVAR
jgi:predicted glycoside hydrolase/deacetylase ChbG (UPF0249 family)